MPGFEALDESWGGTSRGSEGKQELQELEAASRRQPHTTKAVLQDSTHRIASNGSEAFFDAKASLLGPVQHAAAGISNAENDGPRRTWIESKGGKKAAATHLRPTARPNIPSLTSLTDSEAILQPGPSSSGMRKRSQDVKSQRRGLDEGSSSAPESGAATPLAASARFDDALESLRDDGQTRRRRTRSRSSSSSSASSGSGRKQGGRENEALQQAAGQSSGFDAVDATDSISEVAGVTASEGAEATFIHHSDVSDLPPVLRPAWQKGVAGAVDPRTPGKKGKGLTSIGGDMFTPMKLQTMFKTPTPPSSKPTNQLDVPSAAPLMQSTSVSVSKVAFTPVNSPPPSQSRADGPSTQTLKEPQTERSAAFTFRSPAVSAQNSPFAHLATPKSTARKRGLSAEAYAHIGRTPSGSVASPVYQQRSLPLRLFRFGESPKSGQPPLSPNGRNARDLEAEADEAAMSEEDAIRRFNERVQELNTLKKAEMMAAAQQIRAPSVSGSPEKKRIRLGSTTGPQEVARVPEEAAFEEPRIRLTEEQEVESPRKLFRKYSAAEQVDKEIEAERRADRRLRASHYSDDERRRDEEVAALEARIQARRERRAEIISPRKAASTPSTAAAVTARAPPKIALVDEFGNNETIPQGMSRTYSATLIQSSRPGLGRTQSAESASDSVRVEQPIRRYASAGVRARRGNATAEVLPTTTSEILLQGEIISPAPAILPTRSLPRRAVEPIQEVSNETLPSPPAPPISTLANAPHLRVQRGHSADNSGTSDSSDPFKNIESFGSSSPKESPASLSRPAEPIRPAAEQKMPQATPVQPRASHSRSAGGTPPILRPTYAMVQSPNVVPSRGSGLRHEVVPSEDGDTTKSDATGLTQLSHMEEDEEVRTQDQLPESATGPIDDLTSAAVARERISLTSTPLRAGGSSSAFNTPQPPRSILKGVASMEATPVSNRLLQPPRSISFADGKTTGKMFSSSPLKDIDDSWEDKDATPKAKLVRGSQKAPLSRSNGSQSARAAQIQELLRQVAALTMQEEQADQESGRPGVAAKALEAEDDEDTEDSWQAPSPTSRFSQQQSRMQSPFNASRKSLASSRGDGAVAGRSVWNFDDSAVDKTFLTQASFELAHDRMVEVITDVAPWVPDWDELKTIDLRGRKLESVVRLKEFLPKLEEVALDDNEISYFTGLPSTLKSLTVSFNQVPSIASFGHLLHLETLDISQNEVDDLSSLECLQHLRYLKAEHNGIKTLNGILGLSHLHTLSLRGNKLTVLNLQTTSWRKLSTLDVSHNRIVTIRGLATCRHLKSLNVSSNDLSRLDLEPSMPKLRVLRVSSNARLSDLDVLPAKDLRTLYADFCALERIEHLGSLSKLENVSVRQQLNDRGGFLWPASQVKDARRLFLSGNAFGRDLSLYASAPRVPPAFTQLIYLELSACQLETLPSNFSSLFPTLHHLNLDHNLFSKLPKGCFSGLRDLKRLSMVGSRVGKTRNLLEALEGCETLSVLDTRMNPLTLGMYPPMLLASPAGAESQHGSASRPSNSQLTPHVVSPANLAPIPNFQIVRPDTALQQAKQVAEKGQEEEVEGWEKSFFHKRHPAPASAPTTANGNGIDADATLLPPVSASSLAAAASSTSTYALSDARFARTLPESFALKRTLHRGTLGMVCPRLEWLDGLVLVDEEVRAAEQWLKGEEGMQGGRR